MEFTSIGNIGVPVSRVGMGTWSISIRFIYCSCLWIRLSEELVGQALAEHDSSGPGDRGNKGETGMGAGWLATRFLACTASRGT